MTSRQKTLLIILALVNGLCFCCGLPVAFLFLSGDSSGTTTAFLPEPSATPTTLAPTPTRTPLPSPTPQATTTRVIQTPTSLPLATAEPGWMLYPLSQEGFAVSVPSSWAAQNFDPATLASLMQQVQEKNPQYAKVLGSQAPQWAAAGIKFIALDLTPQTDAPGKVTNLNIIHLALPQSTTMTMDYYVAENLKNVQAMGPKPNSLTHRRIKLPAGEAEELRYVAPMVSISDEKTQVAATQYLLLHNRDAYVLTFATDPKLDAKYFSAFEKIARSLQWTNP